MEVSSQPGAGSEFVFVTKVARQVASSPAMLPVVAVRLAPREAPSLPV